MSKNEVETRFLYNPDNGQIFNATPGLMAHPRRLGLIPCPLDILKLRRPELFDKNGNLLPPAKPVRKRGPAAPAPETGSDYLAPVPAAAVEEAGSEAEGVVIDPNRLTLLLEAIGQLDPEVKGHFTGNGIPNASTMSKIVGDTVTSDERDMAWAEHQRLAAQPEE